jgi:hypothetical protein
MVVSFSCILGVVLALFALFRLPRLGAGWSAERVAGGGLLIYVVLATASEQFAWVGNANGVVIGVAWLFPLTLGGVMLPCRDCWLAGLACWCVLFGGVAALTYSASHTGSGVGLFFIWLA